MAPDIFDWIFLGENAFGIDLHLAHTALDDVDLVSVVVYSRSFVSRPSVSPSHLSILAQNAWNVPMVSRSEPNPATDSTRVFISRAALLVNVTAAIRPGDTPTTRIRYAIR